MGGPPVALDFTPNVADGVADAAENAACAEPAPNLSPACAGLRHPRSRCRGLRRSTPAHGYGVVTWPRRWKPLSAQHAARSAPEFFLCARCCKLAKAVDAAVSSACGQGSPVRDVAHVRRVHRRNELWPRPRSAPSPLPQRPGESLSATPAEEKKKIQSKTTIGRAVYKTRGSSPLPVLL
jgi:hypothetical protein